MKKKVLITIGIVLIVILALLISICVPYYYRYMKEERKIAEQGEYIKNIEYDMKIKRVSLLEPAGGRGTTDSYILINTKEKNAYSIYTVNLWEGFITLEERMDGVHENSYEIKKYELTDENINNLIEYTNLSNDDRLYNEEEEKEKAKTNNTFFLDSYILIEYNGKETKLKPNSDIVIIDSAAKLVDTQSSF